MAEESEGEGVAQEASTDFESQSQHQMSRQPSLDIFLYHEVQKFWEVLQIIIISVEGQSFWRGRCWGTKSKHLYLCGNWYDTKCI